PDAHARGQHRHRHSRNAAHPEHPDRSFASNGASAPGQPTGPGVVSDVAVQADDPLGDRHAQSRGHPTGSDDRLYRRFRIDANRHSGLLAAITAGPGSSPAADASGGRRLVPCSRLAPITQTTWLGNCSSPRQRPQIVAQDLDHIVFVAASLAGGMRGDQYTGSCHSPEIASTSASPALFFKVSAPRTAKLSMPVLRNENRSCKRWATRATQITSSLLGASMAALRFGRSSVQAHSDGSPTVAPAFAGLTSFFGPR